MKFEGNISITRDSRNNVNIRLRDKKSRTEFVDVHMSLEDYAMLITGLAEVGVAGEVRGLETVGKKKVMESRSVFISKDSVERNYSPSKFEEYIKDNLQEEGWSISASLRSQRSIVHDGKGGTTLNYGVYKYVEDAE
jgi:hypothetical protein